MASKTIYKIKVLNFEKHQEKLKKGHKAILISVGFLEDPKITMLSQSGKLLFLGLLLRCGDLTSSLIECTHDQLVKYAGGRGVLVATLLDQLQSLQLLSYEKNDLFIKRIEKKVIESNRKELLPIPKKDDSEKLENRKIREAYFNAYRLRYGVDPVANAKFNSQVSQLRKTLGVDTAISVVEFYLKHNDSFFLKNTHSFGLCLSNAETLRTQMLRNQPITNSNIRQLEKTLEQQNQQNEIQQRINNLYSETKTLGAPSESKSS